jgi:hypothetical protein
VSIYVGSECWFCLSCWTDIFIPPSYFLVSSLHRACRCCMNRKDLRILSPPLPCFLGPVLVLLPRLAKRWVARVINNGTWMPVRPGCKPWSSDSMSCSDTFSTTDGFLSTHLRTNAYW